MASITRLFAPTKPMWWLGVALSAGVAASFYVLAQHSIDGEARERFRNQARGTQITVSATIKAYTEVLRGTASYFQAADQITRDTFHRYVQGLEIARNFPAIDSINFAEYFTEAQRLGVEARLRREAQPGDGYPPYKLLPEGIRPEYAVLTMVEPLQGFADRFGLDIAARPPIGVALFSARDAGEMSSSGQPIPLRSAPHHVGMAMRMPIYRKGMPTSTPAERRAASYGSVGLGFSVQRLVESALDDLPVQDMRLVLRSTTSGAQTGTLLYDSQVRQPDPARDSAFFRLSLPIQFHGHTWMADFSVAKSAMYSRIDAYLPPAAAGVGFVASMLVYALFMTLASSRRRAVRMARAMTRELRDSQARLQLSHHRLRRLAAHADQIKEEERKRIAREIHDDLGQNLLALRIEADVLAARTVNRHPRLHARALATLKQIDNTIRSVRHIINDLRPNVLDLGLAAAVEWQVAQFRQRSGVACELEEHGADHGINDHCATAFFRVLQESLSNIHQHAQASLVRIELQRAHGLLRMTIRDNGIGMPEASRSKSGSFGLVGIEERISLLGGTCTIDSSPQGGTTLTVEVPVGYHGEAVRLRA